MVRVRTAEPLQLVDFDSDDDPLSELRESSQGQYLRWYLADLDAKTVLVEPAYFDRDYLSEFAAFYCTSAAGYANVCRRLHYFSEVVDRPALEAGSLWRHHRRRTPDGLLPRVHRSPSDPNDADRSHRPSLVSGLDARPATRRRAVARVSMQRCRARAAREGARLAAARRWRRCMRDGCAVDHAALLRIR